MCCMIEDDLATCPVSCHVSNHNPVFSVDTAVNLDFKTKLSFWAGLVSPIHVRNSCTQSLLFLFYLLYQVGTGGEYRRQSLYRVFYAMSEGIKVKKTF